MKNKNILFIGLAIVPVLIIAFLVFTNNNRNSDTLNTKSENPRDTMFTEEKDNSTNEIEIMPEEKEEESNQPEPQEPTSNQPVTTEETPEPVITFPENQPGKYVAYNSSSLTDSKNVIFFAANWCPTCRALDKAINENSSLIPSDLTILKADYDKETELKKKYGVTYQHTLVQVDKDGNLLNKWSGSFSLEDIASELV